MSKEIRDSIIDGYESTTVRNGYEPEDEVPMWERGCIEQAMSEYAKSQSILFGQWATLNDYTYIKSKDYWVNEEEEENNKKYSNDEIYNLFIEQTGGK